MLREHSHEVAGRVLDRPELDHAALDQLVEPDDLHGQPAPVVIEPNVERKCHPQLGRDAGQMRAWLATVISPPGPRRPREAWPSACSPRIRFLEAKRTSSSSFRREEESKTTTTSSLLSSLLSSLCPEFRGAPGVPDLGGLGSRIRPAWWDNLGHLSGCT